MDSLLEIMDQCHLVDQKKVEALILVDSRMKILEQPYNKWQRILNIIFDIERILSFNYQFIITKEENELYLSSIEEIKYSLMKIQRSLENAIEFHKNAIFLLQIISSLQTFLLQKCLYEFKKTVACINSLDLNLKELPNRIKQAVEKIWPSVLVKVREVGVKQNICMESLRLAFRCKDVDKITKKLLQMKVSSNDLESILLRLESQLEVILADNLKNPSNYVTFEQQHELKSTLIEITDKILSVDENSIQNLSNKLAEGTEEPLIRVWYSVRDSATYTKSIVHRHEQLVLNIDQYQFLVDSVNSTFQLVSEINLWPTIGSNFRKAAQLISEKLYEVALEIIKNENLEHIERFQKNIDSVLAVDITLKYKSEIIFQQWNSILTLAQQLKTKKITSLDEFNCVINCIEFNEEASKVLQFIDKTSLDSFKKLKSLLDQIFKKLDNKPKEIEKFADAQNTAATVYASFETKNLSIFDIECRQLTAYIRAINQYAKPLELAVKLIPICQSSGAGKSKLAAFVASHFHSAYIVFRINDIPESRGYPRDSPLSENFISLPDPRLVDSFEISEIAASSNVGRYLLLIESLLKNYLSDFKACYAQEKDIFKIRRILFDGYYLHSEYHKNVFNFHVDNLDRRSIENVTKCIHNILSELELYRPPKDSPENDPFVLVVDEAQELTKKETKNTKMLDAFHLFRRALYCMGLTANFVVLALGTNSDAADLNIALTVDSYRMGDFKNLPIPYIMPNTWDSILSKRVAIINSAEKMSDSDDPEVLEINLINVCFELLKNINLFKLRCAMGRPLWSSILFEMVARTALKKLLNGRTDNSLLACWMIRTGLNISETRIDLARKLVKSIMATLLHISPDMQKMFAAYPSEPILALAAKEIAGDHFTYFTKLRVDCTQVSADKGRLGEAVSAEIILQAISKATPIDDLEAEFPTESYLKSVLQAKSFVLEAYLDDEKIASNKIPTIVGAPSLLSIKTFKPYFHVVTVENFLLSLYGIETFAKLKNSLPKVVLAGIVNATHFVPLVSSYDLISIFKEKEFTSTKNPISFGLLRYGLLRECGFLMPKCYPGIDMIVPVCLKGAVSSTPVYTFIAVQTKSLQKSKPFEVVKIFCKMAAKNHFSATKHDPTEMLEAIYKNQITLFMEMVVPDEESTIHHQNFDRTLYFESSAVRNLEFLKKVCDPDLQDHQLPKSKPLEIRDVFATQNISPRFILTDKLTQNTTCLTMEMYDNSTDDVVMSDENQDTHIDTFTEKKTEGRITCIYTSSTHTFRHLWSSDSTKSLQIQQVVDAIIMTEPSAFNSIENNSAYSTINTVDLASGFIKKSSCCPSTNEQISHFIESLEHRPPLNPSNGSKLSKNPESLYEILTTLKSNKISP